MPSSPFRHFWLSQDQPSEVIGELDHGPWASWGGGSGRELRGDNTSGQKEPSL